MAEITTSDYQIRYATEQDITVILQMIQELASYERALHEVLATPEKLFNTLSFPTSSNEEVRNKPGFAKALLLIPTSSSQQQQPPPSDPAQQASAQHEVETTTNASSTTITTNNTTPQTSQPAHLASAAHELETTFNAHPPSPTPTPAGLALFFTNYSTWLAQPGIYLEDLFVRPAHRKRGFGKALLQSLARECVAQNYGRLEWSVLKWNAPSIEFYVSKAIGAVDMGAEWSGMRVTGEALERLAGSGSTGR